MNEEQLAALREAAQLDPAKVFAGEDVLPVLAALADARLEIAKRKQGLKDSIEAWEAEVARLREEQDELKGRYAALLDEVVVDVNYRREESDQQRGDIRRLVALVDIALTWMPDNDLRRQLVTFLAEMKERYDA